MIRLVLFAYSEFGTVALEELIALGVLPATLYTHEDDPGEEIFFRTPAALAAERGVPVRTGNPSGPDEIQYLRELTPELILSVYYRSLLPKSILELPRLGAFNLHGSLLPKYRGRAPINWAVLKGETEAGITLHVMTERADAGDIADAEPVPVGPDETAHEVFLKLIPAARRLFRRSLPLLLSGSAPRIPQDEARATKFGRRRPEDGRIDWSRPAREIHNLVRAVAPPYPGAFSTAPTGTLRILKTRPVPAGEIGHAGTRCVPVPGTVLSEAPLRIAAGEGILEVSAAELEGRPFRPGVLPAGTRLG
jgi:methionyl-tRNA formyltransferase